MRHMGWMLMGCMIGLAGWSARAADPEEGAPAGEAVVKKIAPLPAGVRVERDIKYGEAAGKSNLLDLYLSKQDPASPRPLIVYIHGGAWRAGDKGGCMAASMVLQG